MKKNLPEKQTDFLLYTGKGGKISIEVFLKDETVWLTQKAMGQLFGVESHTITYHLKEIFKFSELDEKATTRKIRVVQQEGNRQVQRELEFYNGLRFDSTRGHTKQNPFPSREKSNAGS